MNKRLPIEKIFLKGIRMPFESYKELLRLGWPFIILILPFSFMPEKIDLTSLNIVYLVAICITGVLGAVGCHRVFLLPRETVILTPTFRWGSRETKFLLSLIGIATLAGVISIPYSVVLYYLVNLDFFAVRENGVILDSIFTIMLIPVYYLISRWSLILPDSAVDHDNTLSWAWDISSGQSLRLFVLIGAIPLVTNILFEFITALLDPSYILSLLQNAIWLVVAVIEICLLSLSYEWIISN